MDAVLPISEMSISEKLSAMEALWDDLCQTAENEPSPAWHRDVLSRRENLIREGRAEFSDLSEVKERVRKPRQ